MGFVRLVSVCVIAALASVVTTYAAEVSERLRSSEQVVSGMVVSRAEEDGFVKPASITKNEAIVGVAIPEDAATVSVGRDESDVVVATSGIASVLVSNVSGEIKKGDQLGISEIVGVAGRLENQAIIIGEALQDFPSSAAAAVEEFELDGKTYTVGLIEVQLNVRGNTNAQDISPIPGFLQEFSNNLVGKQVSPIRITVALILLITSFIIDGTLLFATVRSTITSIGRNPLSKHAVFRSLTPIIFIVLGVTAVGLGASYLILATG